MKQACNKFGSWTAAVASYNCGQGRYNEQPSFQRTKYYGLQLPEETSRYLYRIITVKYILENAGSLGFKMSDAENYAEVPCRTVTVASTLPNLVDVALQNETTYKMLRLMNWWLRGTSLPVSRGKTYVVKLPATPLW